MIKEREEFSLYSTTGFSMFPFIRSDDYVLVKDVPPEAIQPGDAIVFGSGDKNKVCHRVVKIEERNGALWFHTKGDRANSCGRPVEASQVLGKVIGIKRKIRFIELDAKRFNSMKYKFDCFFANHLFLLRHTLAKVPFLKRLYRYVNQWVRFL